MVKLELTLEEIRLIERALLTKIQSIKTYEYQVDFIELQTKLEEIAINK